MPILHAIILGIVQGLTEFLPISSSGHLELVPWLFGWNDFADESVAMAFDTALHLGTLVAVVVYLRAELVPYVRHGALLVLSPKRCDKKVGRRAWWFVASAIPAGLAGVVGEEWISEDLGEPLLIAVTLIVFGLVLLWADRLPGRRDADGFGAVDALMIGLAQVLALNPGTSRAGITITLARVRGFTRDAAARVSFLMSVPIIAGAVAFQLGSLFADGIPEGLLVPMIVGIVTAGISGWFAMWGMIRLLRTRAFTGFVVYRVIVGVAVLGLLATSFR